MAERLGAAGAQQGVGSPQPCFCALHGGGVGCRVPQCKERGPSDAPIP